MPRESCPAPGDLGRSSFERLDFVGAEEVTQFTFLPPGTYTVAFTCLANMDNPDQADSAVTFDPIKTSITVTAGQTTTIDIP